MKKVFLILVGFVMVFLLAMFAYNCGKETGENAGYRIGKESGYWDGYQEGVLYGEDRAWKDIESYIELTGNDYTVSIKGKQFKITKQ